MILFSNKLKRIGYIILIPALLIFIFRFILKNELDFLYLPVFAIQSVFFETKYFTWIHSNISDELFSIFLLTGLTIIALSKEKNEIEEYNELRLKAFSLSLLLNGLFLVFGLAFFYGISAIYIISINIFSFLIIYIIVFKILIYKAKKQNRSQN